MIQLDEEKCFKYGGGGFQEVKVASREFQLKGCEETFKWCGAAPQANDFEAQHIVLKTPMASSRMVMKFFH